MPRVLFTATPKLPRDIAHLPYVAGYSCDMTEDQAQRWVRRNVARIVVPVPAAAPVAAPDVAADGGPVLVRASVADIDPETATEAEMRAWLDAKGATPHHRAGEARLREMCMEILTA
jgi:hypothetical protein